VIKRLTLGFEQFFTHVRQVSIAIGSIAILVILLTTAGNNVITANFNQNADRKGNQLQNAYR
jgi:hypothetical protein